MSIGNSGRIVIEVDPELKQQLYEALGKEQMTLKSWFLDNAEEFLSTRSQMRLELALGEPADAS